MTKSGAGVRNAGNRWDDMALLSVEDRATETICGERSSVYLHCMIRYKGNEMMYIYPGVCRIYTYHHSIHLSYPSISIHLPLSLNNVLGGRNWTWLEIHSKARIEQVWRSTWRPRSCELRDGLFRPWFSEFGESIEGWDWVNSEMHLEAIIA